MCRGLYVRHKGQRIASDRMARDSRSLHGKDVRRSSRCRIKNARQILDFDVVLGPLYRSIPGTVAYDRSYMQQRVPVAHSLSLLTRLLKSINHSFNKCPGGHLGANRQVQFSESI